MYFISHKGSFLSSITSIVQCVWCRVTAWMFVSCVDVVLSCDSYQCVADSELCTAWL